MTHGTAWEQYATMRDALNATGKLPRYRWCLGLHSHHLGCILLKIPAVPLTGRPIYYSITQALPFNDGLERREYIHSTALVGGGRPLLPPPSVLPADGNGLLPTTVVV